MKHYKLKAILASFFILYTTGVGARISIQATSWKV